MNKKIIEGENIVNLSGTLLEVSETKETENGARYCFLKLRIVEIKNNKIITEILTIKVFNGLVRLVKNQLYLNAGDYLKIEAGLQNRKDKLRVVAHQIKKVHLK